MRFVYLLTPPIVAWCFWRILSQEVDERQACYTLHLMCLLHVDWRGHVGLNNPHPFALPLLSPGKTHLKDGIPEDAEVGWVFSPGSFLFSSWYPRYRTSRTTFEQVLDVYGTQRFTIDATVYFDDLRCETITLDQEISCSESSATCGVCMLWLHDDRAEDAMPTIGERCLPASA